MTQLSSESLGTASPLCVPVVFETHITDMIRHDSRWQHVWSTFLTGCTVPEDSSTSSRKARQLSVQYERCLEDPQLKDSFAEYAAKASSVFRLRTPVAGQWRLSTGKYTRAGTEEEEKARHSLSEILEGDVASRGDLYYPVNGFTSWRTGALESTGWRLHLIHNVPSSRSSFRYRHPTSGVVQTCVDADGTLRLFRVTVSSPLWHCVVSEGHCWSMAFSLSPQCAARLQAFMRPVVPPRPVALLGVPAKAPVSHGGGSALSPASPSARPTPKAVTLLFGSRSSQPRQRWRSRREGVDDVEEAKSGCVRKAWIRSGEVDTSNFGEEESLSLSEVRLSEATSPSGG